MKTALDWHPDIYPSVVAQDYATVAQFYEEAIESQPDVLSHYWYLGLSYLLGQQEEAAQATWFSPMLDVTESEVATWTAELVQVLQTEAQRQQLDHPEMSWLIRGYLREIAPEDLLNLLHFVALSLELQPFYPEDLTQWALSDQLRGHPLTDEEEQLILKIFAKVLEWPEPNDLISTFIDDCFSLMPNQYPLASAIWVAATKAFYGGNCTGLPAHLTELGLKHIPNHLDLLGALTDFYNRQERYQEAISSAKQFYEHCTTLDLKILGASLVIKGFINSGNLQGESHEWMQIHQSHIKALIEQNPDNLSNNIAAVLATNLVNIPYFKDRQSEDYRLQNKFVSLCEKNLQAINSEKYNRYQLRHQTRSKSLGSAEKRKLKVGYLAKTLRRHSVGWLSRWLFHYHNPEKFDLSIYAIQFAPDDFTQTYFAPYVSQLHNFGMQSAVDVAEQIFADEIDILIDLDSQTSLQSVNILALRPAPIQATWLGWDNTSLSSVDYFIADSYVLPDNAQAYYPEKILKLPNTYLAVDGFEVGVPTLRRDRLGIPADAIVYLSAQKGCKRHPDQIRLQIKILKGVPNSYLLVKGMADETVIQDLFFQIAEEEGVDPQIIQFLSTDPDEETHRANLQIADIVLDTFPYNGATTTLEVLWLGIPLVTQVGNQFSARNSYGFLQNAGIEAGIAWTADEYVEWGIRFGLDRNLREQVSWQLKRSRQHSPLWNAKQFTLDMENTYQHMWADYCANNKQKIVSTRENSLTLNLPKPLNLHIGGRVSHPDWKILDIEDRPEVDFVSNAQQLNRFEDNTVHTIYASHVLEHFHYRLEDELIQTLTEWYRVLEPQGKLMISVPDLKVLCRLYTQPDVTVDQRIHLMQMIFGAQENRYDVHYVGFDFDSLQLCLEEVGFQTCEQVTEFGLFQDSSNLKVLGELISLNVVAIK